MSATMPAGGRAQTMEQTDEHSSRRVSSFPGHIEVELESLSTSSESTDDDTSSTDPGRVATDFDAATSMDWMNIMSPPLGGVPRSLASVPQNYMRSPLGKTRATSITHSSPPASQKSVVRSPPQRAPARGISPFNEYVPPSAAGLQRLSRSLTPKASAEVARFPPVDQERVQKTVESIAESINWTRALTEHDDDFKSEHDAALEILYVLTVRLNQGAPNKHLPLYRSLQKTVRSLTKWCQEVIAHRAEWEWPVISVTLRGYIQKFKDIHAALEIDSDPNALALKLNARIEAHNANRSEAEVIRQARKQKEMEDKVARKRARAEIRALHQQFVTLKRAQAEGVEVTDYLEDDTTSRRQIEEGESEGGSRSRYTAGSLHTLQSGPSLPPPPSPTTTSDKPSISSLGNVLPRKQVLTASPSQSVGSKDRSGEQPTTSSPRVPPTSPNSPPEKREKARSLASLLSSKPLPHRPISMSDINGSAPFSPSRIRHDYAGPESKSQSHDEGGDDDEHWDGDGVSDGSTSLPRSNRSKSPIPPIHVTPSASLTSPKSDIQRGKSLPGSADAIPSIPPESEGSTTPVPLPTHSDPHYVVVQSPRSPKGSSDMDDLTAMFDRVANKPGPSIAPTAAHTTVAGNGAETYRGSTRPELRPHTARPNGNGNSGLKNSSIKGPFSEAYPLTEDAERNTQSSTNPPSNEDGWLKSIHENGFHSQSQMPGVHIKLYESEFPPGINEMLNTMKGPSFPRIAKTIIRSQADTSHNGDYSNRPAKHPSPPVVYEPSVDDQGTVRGNSEKARNSGGSSGKQNYPSRIPSIA